MNRISAWDRPVLQSVLGVVKSSAHVHTSEEAVNRVALWMAYEEFAPPSGSVEGPFNFGPDPCTIIDATLLTSSLNFAYTDFESGERFETNYMGKTWADAEAMFARIHQSHRNGTPIFEGGFLADVTAADLAVIFEGNIEMPMLEERSQILNEIGKVLVERYDGRFHNFVQSCEPAAYAGGNGLLERLTTEFPRFADTSSYNDEPVIFYKLGQLCLWSLHVALSETGALSIRDLDNMSAFADYILPIALDAMSILEFSEELENRIADQVLIPRDSDEEIEIRAHTLFATAMLTDAINAIRPADRQVVIPQVDFRLWSIYHTAFPTLRPHHLTRTILY
ncbi:MAG: queuosine salvage family protein [Acidimicrobiales bacterium]|nr:queuosine salvage family protein [Acidimicrobiales bacterium]